MKSLEQRLEAIRSALQAKLGPPYKEGNDYWRSVATFDDGVIVEQGGKLARYAAAFDLFGKVTLGDAKPVEIVYQALKESVGSCILGPMIEEGEGVKAGSKWAVVIIQEGVSANRTDYSANVLRAATPLYEGVHVFWNHRLDNVKASMPDPRDTAGVITAPKAALLENGKTAVLGTMKAITKEARERLLEAHEAGALSAYGLSHTAHAETERVKLADGPALRVTKINAVESVDIVSFPSAGGRVLRLVAGMAHPVETTEEDLMNFAQKLAHLKESRPDLFSKLSATPTEAEVDQLIMEALKAPPTPAPVPAPSPQPAPAPVPAPAPAAGLSDADRALLKEGIEANKALVIAARAGVINAALQSVSLPAPALEELRESLEGMPELTLDKAREAVKTKVQRVARMLEAAGGMGFGAGVVVEGVADGDGSEKALNLLDDLLFTDASDKAKGEYERIAGRQIARPDTHSIKEAYFLITGDSRFTGRPPVRESLRPMSRFDGLMRKRVVEGRRLVEGLLQTTTWAEVFGDSVARRMIAEYRTQPFINDWRIIASVVPVQDFRTRHAIRWGGYNDLPTVAQGIGYVAATTPGDEEVTYSPSKRGYIESLTWEAMVNDDLGQVRNIPVKMGRAAARTLYKFVTITLLAANPSLDYDATVLFHANHGNLISTALTAANISVARQKLADQTDMSTNDKLNLYPNWLMVPTALEELGWRIVNVPVANVAGQNATEPSYQRSLGLNTLIVNPYLTDASDWFVGADKGQAQFMEIGFLFGQEEPTIVVADIQNAGNYFTTDSIDYKIRHVYGGDVVDHRPVVGGLVA